MANNNDPKLEAAVIETFNDMRRVATENTTLLLNSIIETLEGMKQPETRAFDLSMGASMKIARNGALDEAIKVVRSRMP